MNKDDAMKVKQELDNVLGQLKTIKEMNDAFMQAKDNLNTLAQNETKLINKIIELIEISNKVIGDESLLSYSNRLNDLVINLNDISKHSNIIAEDVLRVKNTTDIIQKTVEGNEKISNNIYIEVNKIIDNFETKVSMIKENISNQNVFFENKLKENNVELKKEIEENKKNIDVLQKQIESKFKKSLFSIGVIGIIIIILLIVILVK